MLNGWTWFYIALGAVFAFVGEVPGLVAAVFWWSIAALNEAVDRWF